MSCDPPDYSLALRRGFVVVRVAFGGTYRGENGIRTFAGQSASAADWRKEQLSVSRPIKSWIETASP
jgi:hypothetical protein